MLTVGKKVTLKVLLLLNLTKLFIVTNESFLVLATNFFSSLFVSGERFGPPTTATCLFF